MVENVARVPVTKKIFFRNITLVKSDRIICIGAIELLRI